MKEVRIEIVFLEAKNLEQYYISNHDSSSFSSLEEDTSQADEEKINVTNRIQL